MTNMGLCIDVPLLQVPGKNDFIAVLLCGSTIAGKDFLGLLVSVHNLDHFRKRGFLLGSMSISGPAVVKRYISLDPIPLKLKGIGFDKSVPWDEIDWDASNRKVKAPVVKLYIPQDSVLTMEEAGAKLLSEEYGFHGQCD
jgi:hypothetical protein